MDDLTVIYYTANAVPEKFGVFVRATLQEAIKQIPLISVSQKPLIFGHNICIGNIGRSHINIYKQALIGAKAATTKYIALAEDDILYSSDHFTYRPQPDTFAYDMSVWSIYTWVSPPIFSYKGRRNLSQLVCERQLFIDAMEERFKKYPDESKINIAIWAEPGKYEKNLAVTERKSELYYSHVPSVAFSHETALSFLNLGKRKKLGELRVTALPQWGSAEEVIRCYV